MPRKYFIVLGLFLAAGFLFTNAERVNAAWTWVGGGDAKTWTDPLNWTTLPGTSTCAGCYPGATSTSDNVTISAITNATTIYATTTLYGLGNVTLQSGTGGSPTLIIGKSATVNASSSVVLVSSTSTLKMGDGTWGSGTLKLGNGNNNAIPLQIGGSATFIASTAATGTVTYTGLVGQPGNTIFVATTTFYTLDLTPTSSTANLTFKVATSSSATVGAGGGTFNTAATFVVATGATFTNNGTITATNATAWTNNGTVSQGVGAKIVLASATQLDDGSGTAKSTFNADARDSVGVQVTDTSLNLNASTAETQSANITAKSLITDSETITLTETTVSSGIFRGSVQFQLSGTDVAGKLDYQGPGTLSYTFVDSQDSSDTGTGGAGSFTGTAPGGGSSGAITVVVVAPATPATPAVPAETSAVPATPAVPAVPSLESVQSKVASVVARIAALPAKPSADDLALVQAEIAAILVDIKAIQAAQPAPQGVALGFNFVRPLALGLRHADVSKLQEALKTDSSVYPEGLVTGYFGPATLKAVQKFQEKYGLASSGVAGYGSVGPKTRAKLNELFK